MTEFTNVTHDRGVLFVSTGAKHTAAAAEAAQAVAETNPSLGIAIFTDQPVSGAPFHYVARMGEGASRRKHEFIALTPFRETLYLDSDARVTTDLTDFFRLLEKYEMAGAHVRLREAPKRLKALSADIPRAFPQINCGVMLYKRCANVDHLFAEWRRLYTEGGFTRDQTPFREALWRSDVRFYVVGPEYNKRDIPVFGFGREPPPKILHIKSYNSRSPWVKLALAIATWPARRRIRAANRLQSGES